VIAADGRIGFDRERSRAVRRAFAMMPIGQAVSQEPPHCPGPAVPTIRFRAARKTPDGRLSLFDVQWKSGLV